MATVIGISGTDFTLNGQPTYAGRTFEGQRIAGLLFNVRAVQATFDDSYPATATHWAYPDAGVWDAERNVREFIAALPIWRAHGVLGFTLNFQGGGAIYRPEVYDHFDNNAFTPAGELKPDYADRFARIFAAADELGMVPIVGLFYGKHLQKMDGEAAIIRAAENALAFLRVQGHRNLLVELANELDVAWTLGGYDLLSPQGAPAFIQRLRTTFPEFLYGASLGGMNPDTPGQDGIPSDDLITAQDFVLLHGNGCSPERLAAGIDATRARSAYQRQPKPLIINEDSIGIPNLDTAWRKGVSWGYYDQGYGSGWGGPWEYYANFRAHAREPEYEHLSGFQTPPVNWGINTSAKRAFFRRVCEVTGTNT